MTQIELQTAAPSTTERLSALAAAGAFLERRIARGEFAHGERETSDQVAVRLAPLLAQLDAPEVHEADATLRLPADALDRLKGVNGIGDALAQKALDALTQ